MFQDIMKRQITTERISSFLKMALMEQKSLQQYLHFLPQAEEAVSQMDETMTLVMPRNRSVAEVPSMIS